jgi:hypothetical protein
MNREDDVTPEELGPLATRAVDELIADVESGRFRKTGRQLAEVIISCIRHTRPTQLRTLKWFLKQRALENPLAEQHRTKTKGSGKIH